MESFQFIYYYRITRKETLQKEKKQLNNEN